MIVTRRRQARRHIERVLVPLAVAAAVVAASWWPPSRAWLHGIPPVGRVMDATSALVDVTSLQTALRARDRSIAALKQQVTVLDTEIQARDKQISALTSRANRLDQQLAEVQQPRSAAGLQAANPSSTPVADAQAERTARVWNEMDPDAAAKVAERLPDAYVARVLAQMEPGQVADILAAMPPTLAARLTATRPSAGAVGVQRGSTKGR